MDPIHGDVWSADDARQMFCQVHGWLAVEYPSDFAREHNGRSGCTPTLDTAAAAVALLDALVDRNRPWLSVFWDGGWGESGEVAEVSIIEGGNGQAARALITAEVYSELVASGAVGPNTLRTFKARRLHNYRRQLGDCAGCNAAAERCGRYDVMHDVRSGGQCCGGCVHRVVEWPAVVAR